MNTARQVNHGINIKNLWLAILTVLLICAKPMRANADQAGSPVLLKIEFENNLFMDRLDVDVHWDDQQLAVLEHGQNFAKLLRDSNKKHRLTFYLHDKHKIVNELEVDVNGETTLLCTIKTHKRKIDIKNIEKLANADIAKRKVEDIHGRLCSEAVRILNESGLSNHKIFYDGSEKNNDKLIVVGQTPAPGSRILYDEEVGIECEEFTVFCQKNFDGLPLKEAVDNAKKEDVSVGYCPLGKSELTKYSYDKIIGDTSIDDWIVESAVYQSEIILQLVFNGKTVMPNLLGKAADKASGVLHKNHIYNYSYNKKKSELTSCLVAAQSISPGSDVDSSSKPITITCIPYKDLDRLTMETLDSKDYPEVLSVSGNKEFRRLTQLSDRTDSDIDSFFDGNKGKMILFKGNVVCCYEDDDEQQYAFLRSGDYSQYSLKGPAYRIRTNSDNKPRIADDSISQTISEGENLMVLARITGYDNDASYARIAPYYIKVTGTNSVNKAKDNYYSKATARSLQRALNDAGYDCGTPDGQIGPHSREAISNYKNDHGMGDDSSIDFALLASLGVQAMADPVEPQVRSNAQSAYRDIGQDTVWVPRSGKGKYHSTPYCSRMKNPISMTREQAESRGYEPCKKCD